MADISVEPSILHSLSETYIQGQNVVFVSPAIGFMVYRDSSARINVAYTVDGGATWNDFEAISPNKYWDVWGGGGTGIGHHIAVWYDGWTQDLDDWATGDHSTRIHVLAAGSTTNDVKYAWIDVFEGRLTSVGPNGAVDIKTGLTVSSGNVADHSLNIVRARSGRLYALFNVNGGTAGQSFLFKSDDEGATWQDEGAGANPYESNASDKVVLLPGSTTDKDDIVAFWYDLSAGEIRPKRYDASLQTWSEGNVVISGLTNMGDSIGMAGARRFSDGRFLLAVDDPRYDQTGGTTVRTYEVTDNETVTSMTITEKAAIISSLAEAGWPSICIDQTTDDVYVTYIEAATAWATDGNVKGRKSTDGMANWTAWDGAAGSTTLNADTAGETRWAHLPRSIGSEGGVIQSHWHVGTSILTENIHAVSIDRTRKAYFRDLPATAAKTPNTFTALWESAANRQAGQLPILALGFGPSHTATPDGAGETYAFAFNTQLSLLFGNLPCTPMVTGRQGSQGGNDPQLLGGAYVSGKGASVLDADEQLPGWTFAADDGTSGWRPQLWFAHDANGAPHVDLRYGSWFRFSPDQMPVLLFHIIAHPSSNTFDFLGKTQDDCTHNVFSMTALENNIDAGQGGTNKAVKVWEKDLASIPQISAASGLGPPYISLTCQGDSTTSPGWLESFGMRLLMPKRTGVVVDWHGSPGRASAFQTSFADALTVPKEMTDLGYGYSFAIVKFGAHEIGNNDSPSSFKTDMEAFLSWIRATFGATFPVVFMTDWYRATLLGTADREKLGQYPAALQEIAAANSHVLAINSGVALDAMGFTYLSETEGLYTDQGTYVTATAYAVDDIVDYATPDEDSGGHTRRWICIQATTGGDSSQDPPNMGYWQPMGRFLITGDGVHLRPAGAALQAQIEASLLVSNYTTGGGAGVLSSLLKDVVP